MREADSTENATPSRGRVPVVSLAVVALAAIAFVAPQGLEVSRDGLSRGELYRVFTGHFAHYSLYHFVLDAGTLLALGWLFERRYGGLRWGALLAVAAVAISLAFLRWERQLETYRGLSGLDCAAFAAAIVEEMKRRRTVAWLAAVLFAAKLAVEQIGGAFIFPALRLGDTGLPVLSAHTVGAAAGLLTAVTTGTWPHRTAPPSAVSMGKSSIETGRYEGRLTYGASKVPRSPSAG